MKILDAIKRAQVNAPVNVFGLAADLGVKINTVWFDDPEISGELVKRPDGNYEINVNGLHPVTRQRFTVAHELGHFIYHRDLIGDGITDNKAYRSTAGYRYSNSRIGPRHETQANRFAASLLMPHELIEDLREQGLGRDRIAAALQVSEHALAIRTGESYP
jgi:Zn-dependent peptidase ImmA (M78 family)